MTGPYTVDDQREDAERFIREHSAEYEGRLGVEQGLKEAEEVIRTARAHSGASSWTSDPDATATPDTRPRETPEVLAQKLANDEFPPSIAAMVKEQQELSTRMSSAMHKEPAGPVDPQYAHLAEQTTSGVADPGYPHLREQEEARANKPQVPMGDY